MSDESLEAPLRGSLVTRHSSLVTLLGALLATLPAAPSPAQSVAEIAAYAGPDREQRLVEGAKKEGGLMLYTSFSTADLSAFVTAFEKKYGIKVNHWRSSSENVVQRAVTEARAQRFEVDAFETNGPELEALHREKLLQEVRSPHFAALVAQAHRPHREWTATRFNIFVAAYNTNLVQRDALPKTWADLASPKWKGKLGIEAYDHDWFAGVVSALGEAQGLKVFREIVAANGMSVRKGHTLLSNLVVSGEVPVALTLYHYRPAQLKSKGAPIDWFVIPPALARPQGIAVARRAPHPHAAVLFYDFMLSDAQALMPGRNFTPSSAKVAATIQDTPQFRLIDPRLALDDGDKWEKLWEEIIVRPGR